VFDNIRSMSAHNEVDISALTSAEREAVLEATVAVVNRDVERVRHLLREEHKQHAADFWIWADDYGVEGRLRLVDPPGGIDDWAISVVPLLDGSGFDLEVPVWVTIGETDLTLELKVSREEGREPRVELHDLHVL
jgi:hypothetical protein